MIVLSDRLGQQDQFISWLLKIQKMLNWNLNFNNLASL